MIIKKKKKLNLLQDKLEQTTKKQILLKNGFEKIAKMQNLSQNEFEQITKMRRLKNYKNISKEGLLIALLKSKHTIDQLFDNNSDNDRITGIKKSSMN